MNVSPKDRGLIRDLAARVAEIAALPVMAERRAMWIRHNKLQRVRPMILVFPEGAWRELIPETALQCETPETRDIERALRVRLYYHEHIFDDTVIEKEWRVSKVVSDTGWGIEPKRIPSTAELGSWAFDPVINSSADLKKLRVPEVQHDEAETAQKLRDAQELFGDIMDVRLRGVCAIAFHLMAGYTALRGLEQVMWDMIDNPAMLHDAMAFMEEGYRRRVRQYEELNLLDVNNDLTYHSSGGVGFTDELPSKECDPKHVRPADMWASAESQEMAQVSPDMHHEFVMQYESRLLAPFGLNGYGCCENLTEKLDYVLQIPHIRRISIAPSADVDKCAEKLGSKTIFSWKPQPAHLVGDFNERLIRDYIKHTLDVTRDRVIEMILKDTHTCENHPERFTRWTQIARDLAEQY